VALANDYDLVCAGLKAMLTPYSSRIELVGPIRVGSPLPSPIDVVLYDTYGREGLVTDPLRELVADPDAGRVALYTFSPSPELIDVARDLGVAAILPKTLRAAELVPALESIAAGCEPRLPLRGRAVADERTWPGKGRGLTERESEVVVLLAQGLQHPGDRRRPVRVDRHGQDPPTGGVPQAGGLQPGAGNRGCPARPRVRSSPRLSRSESTGANPGQDQLGDAAGQLGRDGEGRHASR
jgi:DNA-binding NarL/FixJ family response regulator